MYRVELFDRSFVSAIITRCLKRIRILRLSCLPDENTEEYRVETAFKHLRQVHLGIKALRIVPLRGKISRRDIAVGVEHDHAFVNRLGFLHQLSFERRTRRTHQRARSS